MKWLAFLLSLWLPLSFASANPKSITLTLPTQMDGTHLFYHELLKQSLADIGVKLVINTPFEHIPQKRLIKMVENNQLSLMWLVQSRERDAQYPFINAPVTKGLIGQRVLFIPKGAQAQYNQINSLEDLQRSGLVAGLGSSWFDTDVWQANHLAYYPQDGEWRALYDKLSRVGPVNYFPRGINEIMTEARLVPNLDIEQRLLIVYDRDFRFYLSESAERHQTLLQEALERADKSGLLQRLIDTYWLKDLKKLNLEKRVVIRLPNSGD